MEFSTGNLTISENNLIDESIEMIIASEPSLSEEADVLIDHFISPVKIASIGYCRLHFFQRDFNRKLQTFAGSFNCKVVHFFLDF